MKFLIKSEVTHSKYYQVDESMNSKTLLKMFTTQMKAELQY